MLKHLLDFITPPSLFGYESISMAHLDFAIFACTSLQKCSKSVRLRGHLLCTACFRSLHRFSNGFRSGLLLGHSKTLFSSGEAISFVDLDVCFGLLSYWKMKFLFIFSFLAEAWRFCTKAWCCHHHASLWVWCSFGDVLFCAKHTFWNHDQKVQPWFHQTITHFIKCFWETYNVFLLNLARAWKFFLPPYPMAQIYEEYGRLLSRTTQPVLTRNSCSSFNVAVSLLAASLTSFLLIFSSILEGHPVLGNVTVEPYFLHLVMTVFTVFHGISNTLEIILYTSTDW